VESVARPPSPALVAGMSIDDVAERAMFSATKLSRLETGRVGASPRDIRDLCIVYGITDAAERERLMALAREGKQRAWWQRRRRR
jgi:transcriptional regulator with XRE-family HTH domain